MKRWLSLLLAALLLVTCLAACGDALDDGSKKGDKGGKGNAAVGLTKQEEKYIEQLKELMVAADVYSYSGRYGNITQVTISMPPYEEYFEELLPEAEKSATTAAKFGEVFLKMVMEKASEEDAPRITYKKDLYAVDIKEARPDVTDMTALTEEELASIAITAVFDELLEKFCMNVIMNEAPELTVKGDEQ